MAKTALIAKESKANINKVQVNNVIAEKTGKSKLILTMEMGRRLGAPTLQEISPSSLESVLCGLHKILTIVGLTDIKTLLWKQTELYFVHNARRTHF